MNDSIPLAGTLSGMTRDDPRWNNLGYWNYEAARAYPDRIALIDLSRSPVREVRYRELEERLDRMASLVARLGIKPGDRLAMSVSNRFEFVEIMFGAMRAGVVPVPLNTKLGPDTLDYVVRDAGCTAAIVEEAANEALPGIIDRIGCAVRIGFAPSGAGWLRYEEELRASAPRFTPQRLADSHMSFLPYTSGSTGRPKGVVLSHAGQCWWVRCLSTHWPTSPEHRGLAAVPLYHKNAMAGAIKAMLSYGGSVVLLPNFSPRPFLEALSHYRCTHAGGVPAVFTLLLQERDLIESLDFSALVSMRIGSAPTPKELCDAVEAAFGVPVSESYGLTEGGPVMIGAPVDGRAVPHGSCGVVWPEGEVKLVDSDGRDDPHYGELWVRNPGVTPGYYNLPEVNRARLKDGWLKTGDLFACDKEGFYYFKGRTDDMFKSGGESVYPLEVENILLKHPAVAEVSVVPVPHRIKGAVPVAMVVKARGREVSEEELKQYCLSNGPAYAHPRRITFVAELPLNGPGKIDRKIVERTLAASFGTLG
ncbi:MAG: class I adenylate-forming enzyme family protein [Alphaproteobacteria bacterium]